MVSKMQNYYHKSALNTPNAFVHQLVAQKASFLAPSLRTVNVSNTRIDLPSPRGPYLSLNLTACGTELMLLTVLWPI